MDTAWLSRAEAVAALREAGYAMNENALAQRDFRGCGPPLERFRSTRTGRMSVRYERTALLAWAAVALRRPTALGVWLRDHRESAQGFARRLMIGPWTVQKMIGGLSRQRALTSLPADVLELISLETGIPIGRLCEDALNSGERHGSGAATDKAREAVQAPAAAAAKFQ